MSRIAKSPINIPSGSTLTIDESVVSVKGSKGELSLSLHRLVAVEESAGVLRVDVKENTRNAWAQAGTCRALLNNMIIGTAQGFTKKLTLIGVGYRGQLKGKILNLTLGFSHPVEYSVPDGVTISTPSQTEIIIEGCDKQRVGQVAAEIRAFRPPEPYKGKGVRYSDEHVVRKDAKKK